MLLIRPQGLRREHCYSFSKKITLFFSLFWYKFLLKKRFLIDCKVF